MHAVSYVAIPPLPRDGRFDFLSHGSANIPGDTLNRPRLTARNVEYAACRRRLLQRLGKRPRNVAHLNEIALLPPILEHERSEEHTSELQSLMRISYAVFCLKKKKKQNN